jgi:hypothetical protein
MTTPVIPANDECEIAGMAQMSVARQIHVAYRRPPAIEARAGMPAFEFSYKLR